MEAQQQQQHAENNCDNNSDHEATKYEEPLQNHIIVITSIFKILPFKDKKNFRLVSKLWLDITLEYWRGTSVVLLRENNKKKTVKRFVNTFKASPAFAGFYKIERFPFQNFRIEKASNLPPKLYLELMMLRGLLVNVTNEKTIDAHCWSGFWDVCGPSMTVLHLSNCSFRGPSQLSVIESILLDFCRNLKTLFITEPSYPEYTLSKFPVNSDGKVAANLERFFMRGLTTNWLSAYDGHQLLKMMPNVQTLGVNCSTLSIALALPKPINLKTSQESPPKFAKIGQLALDLSSERETKKRAKSERNKLSLAFLKEYYSADKEEDNNPNSLKNIDLTLSLDLIRRPSFEFREFLHSAKDTLDKLTLRGMDVLKVHQRKYFLFRDLNGNDFPQLTHLNLNFTSNALMRFDFSALVGMSKLKSFRCVAGDHVSWKTEVKCGEENNHLKDILKADKIKSLEISLPDLEKFDYFVPKAMLDLDCFRYIASWSGNLRKLQTAFINDRSFVGAIYLWSKLVEITLYHQGSSVDQRLRDYEWFDGKNKIAVTVNTMNL